MSAKNAPTTVKGRSGVAGEVSMMKVARKKKGQRTRSADPTFIIDSAGRKGVRERVRAESMFRREENRMYTWFARNR